MKKNKHSESSAIRIHSAYLLDNDRSRQQYNDEVDDVTISRSARIVWLLLIMVACFIAWAYFANLEEVTKAEGRFIPSAREQVIKTREGGILKSMPVREGDIVEANQVVAQLRPTIMQSSIDEAKARYYPALARAARLEGQVLEKTPSFPTELSEYPDITDNEMRIYEEGKRWLDSSLNSLRLQKELILDEMNTYRELVEAGAAGRVDVIRLEREASQLDQQINELQNSYFNEAREKLSTAKETVEETRAIIEGRNEQLEELVLRSPVRGVVKQIAVPTIGGLVQPQGVVMEIIPTDDEHLIEARIQPRDVAYIRPGLPAKVSVTAYDPQIYGKLDGEVVSVSPDTIQDEADPNIFYYRGYIRISENTLSNDSEKALVIVPGMVASVDIKTGSKTVWNYLVKPITDAGDALRER